MATGKHLTDEQIAQARALWDEGNTLGVIAETVGCSVYALRPWLYAAAVDPIIEATEDQDGVQ